MDAYRYYDEAARIAPWDPVSHEAIAALLDEQGRYQEALQSYNVVLRNSQDPEALALAYSNLSVIDSRLGNRTQARADAEQASKIAPAKIQVQIDGLTRFYEQNPSAKGYVKLSLLLNNMGRTAEARAACKKAAAIDSSSPDAHVPLDCLKNEDE
jgi:tetratricopeptide (TPR) repeat protein